MFNTHDSRVQAQLSHPKHQRVITLGTQGATNKHTAITIRTYHNHTLYENSYKVLVYDLLHVPLGRLDCVWYAGSGQFRAWLDNSVQIQAAHDIMYTVMAHMHIHVHTQCTYFI